MNKRVTNAGKVLLKNTIRSVNHENRLQEERLCWEAKNAAQLAESSRHRHRQRDYSASSRRPRSPASDADRYPSDKSKNYYFKKLLAAKEADTSRWGHGGFKELYPEKFQSSSDSGSEDSKQNIDHHKSASKSSSREREPVNKRVRDQSSSNSSSSSDSDRSSKRSKHRKKRKSHDSDSSDSGHRSSKKSRKHKKRSQHSSDDSDHEKRKKRKKRSKSKKSKSKKRKS